MYRNALMFAAILTAVFAAGAHAQLVDGYKGKYVMYHCGLGKPSYYFSYSINKIEEDLFEITSETLYLDARTGEKQIKVFGRAALNKDLEISSYELKDYALKNGELARIKFNINIALKREEKRTLLEFDRNGKKWTKEMPPDWIPMLFEPGNGISYVYVAMRLTPEMIGKELVLISPYNSDRHTYKLLDVKERTVDMCGRDYSGQAYIFEDITPSPYKHPLIHKYVIIFVCNGEFLAYLDRGSALPDRKPCGRFMHIIEDFDTQVQFVFPEQFK